MTQNIQYKAGNAGQINIDQAQGIVECFVAGIGNKDSVGDVVISGAFAKSLTRRKPRVVWGHNWNEPIGKVLEMYEVPVGDPRLPGKMKAAGIGGLYAKVQFNLNSEKGKEAFANVAFFGEEQEWSIGYKTLDAVYDPKIKANILKEVELYEVSPVLHGANQLTGTISVKSDEETKNHMHMMGVHRGPVSVVLPVSGPLNNEDAQARNLFAEGEAEQLDEMSKQKLTAELMKRTGSMVKIIKATENSVLFRRVTSDGNESFFRAGYHTPDGGNTFMFSKPERVIQQTMYVPASDMGMQKSGVVEQAYGSDVEDDETYDDGTNAGLTDGEEEKAIWDNIARAVFRRGKKFKKDADIELETLDILLNDDFDIKAGRVLSSRNLSKLRSAIESLQEVLSSAEKQVEVKEEHVIPVPIEEAFHVKQAIDPILDYYRVESYVAEDGIVITSGIPEGFSEAITTAFKSLGGSIGGGGPGKARRAGRVLTGTFDPNAVDADGDGLVQEGTAFERPATPNVPEPKRGFMGQRGMVQRDEHGNVDASEAVKLRQKLYEDRIKRLKDLGFSDEEIQALHGQPKRGMASRTVGAETNTGKAFGDVKPKDWDSLDPYEKERQLTGDLKPEKSGLNREVWVAQMQRVFDEQVKLEERKAKEEARASKPKKPSVDRPKPQEEPSPKKAAKRIVRDLPKTEDDAAKMRADDIESLQNAITYIEKLNERNQRGNKAKHAKLIEALSVGLEDDLTLDGISKMREDIDKHARSIDTRNMTPADKNVQRGIEVLDQRLAALDKFYEKDRFIDRGSRGELDLSRAERVAGIDTPDADEVGPQAIGARLVRGESNAPKEPEGFESSRKRAKEYLNSSKRKKMGRGFASSRDGGNEKAGRSEIAAEATWFKQIEESLPKEIREAQKAGDKATADSLTLLQTIMRRQESGKTGSRRTNAGVLATTQEETDKILEAVMAVVDRQVSTGGSRAEIFSQLMDKMAQAAMATFIDKTVEPIGKRER